MLLSALTVILDGQDIVGFSLSVIVIVNVHVSAPHLLVAIMDTFVTPLLKVCPEPLPLPLPDVAPDNI